MIHCYSTFSTVCKLKKRKITNNIIVNSWHFTTNLLRLLVVKYIDLLGICDFNFYRTEYSISLPADTPYTGQVNLTYLGNEGRICNDGWTDVEAGVACRELGFSKGFAYTHYKSEVDSTGPYWSSQFNCTGNETRLDKCQHVGFGNVTQCKSKHYAGVLCVESGGE